MATSRKNGLPIDVILSSITKFACRTWHVIAEPRWQQIEKIERGRFGIDGWRPRFIDYLFVAFTQSSTFGPTDAPLLGRWSKCLTMMQIAMSLTVVIVLISRAVGVL